MTELNKLPLEERYKRASDLRTILTTTLKEQIAKEIRDRDEMVEAYNERIGELESQLHQLGERPSQSVSLSSPSIRALNYLKANAGQQIQAGQLMRAIGSKGAVASIVMADLILSGQVKQRGASRASVYWVDANEIHEDT